MSRASVACLTFQHTGAGELKAGLDNFSFQADFVKARPQSEVDLEMVQPPLAGRQGDRCKKRRAMPETYQGQF